MNDKHLEINPTGTLEIMLLENEPVTYKIPSYGQPSGCEVKITYPPHDHNMIVFTSFTNPQPSKLEFDHRYFSPNKLSFKPEFNLREFTN